MVAAIEHGDILKAIAVEVGDGHRSGIVAGGVRDLGCEGAVAVAEQDTDGAVIQIGENDVGFTVVIEIARGEAQGVGSRRVADLRLEGAVAVAQQDAERAGGQVESRVCHRHVELAVVVEVSKDDLIGGLANAGRSGAKKSERF